MSRKRPSPGLPGQPFRAGRDDAVNGSPQTSADYRIDGWQTPDGLPGNTVTAIQQTGDGYLWIGTLSGLARFDGLRFKIFGVKAPPCQNPGCCSSLLAARDGSLWIGTDGGVIGAKPPRDISHLDSEGWDWRRTPCDGAAEDGADRIWVGTPVGLSCLHDGQVVRQMVPEPGPGSAVSAIVEDREKSIWVVAANQLFVRQGDHPFHPPAAADPSSFSTVFAAEAGRSGQLWFGGANGYLGAISNGMVHVFGEQPGQLIEATWALCETRNGDLWASATANGGIALIAPGETHLAHHPGRAFRQFRCVVFLKTGKAIFGWESPPGAGLNRVKPRKVKTFTTRDGPSHNVVMSIAEDAEGTFWTVPIQAV